MIYIKAVLMGLLEGITEFLPISSTGHLIILEDFLNLNLPSAYYAFYMVSIQFAAILALIILYFSLFWNRLIGLFKLEKKSLHFWRNLMLASLPAAIFGFIADDFIEKHFFNIYTVTFGLFFGAVLLLFSENNIKPKAKICNLDDITPKSALFAGFGQCMALIPGMSRSASSIIGSWCGGLKTSLACEFSFFMAIPVMFGASLYSFFKILKHGLSLSSIMADIGLITGLSCIFSFIAALVVVKTLLKLVKKYPLAYFAYYRIFLAIVLLFYVFIKS